MACLHSSPTQGLCNLITNRSAVLRHRSAEILERHAAYLDMLFFMQLRGQEGLRRRILLRAGLREDGSALEGIAPADGLLLVSGSHPARGALRWTGMLQDSRAGLKQAAALKRQGLLPRSTALWAVANPLVDAADSLERKASSLLHVHHSWPQ